MGADYLRFLERRGLAPASVNARRAAVVALYAALRWTGASSADPMRDTPAVRDPTPRHESGSLTAKTNLKRSWLPLSHRKTGRSCYSAAWQACGSRSCWR